jgi:hypothetical protein
MNTNGIDGLGGAVGVCTGWVRAGAGAGRVLCRISFDQKGVVETPTHPLVRFYFYSPPLFFILSPIYSLIFPGFFSHNLSIFGWLMCHSSPPPPTLVFWFSPYISLPWRYRPGSLTCLYAYPPRSFPARIPRTPTYIHRTPSPPPFSLAPYSALPPARSPLGRRVAPLVCLDFLPIFFGIAAGTRLAGCVGWLGVVK